MTDFVDDLERELLAAARRGTAYRRRLIRRPSLKPLLARGDGARRPSSPSPCSPAPDGDPSVAPRPQPAVVAPRGDRPRRARRQRDRDRRTRVA